MINRYWTVLFIAFISGCAVKPISSTQTAESLIITLSGKENSKFVLVDSSNNIIAEDQGDDGNLQFVIPNNTSVKSCVHVRDTKGKNFGNEQYDLSVITEFRQVQKYRTKLERRHDQQTRQYSELLKKYQETKIKLEGHSAFSNRRCHTPIQRPLPPMPATRCSSYNECLSEGGGICYSRFLGTEGCSLALKELNVAGMLSSPGCAAIAAELAGEKYNMDDAFVDFLHGVADDFGKSLVESDSILDNFLGLIVIGTNYGIKIEKARVCTNNFVEHYYGPKLVWQQKVREIKLEPQAIKNNCNRLIVSYNDYLKNLNTQDNRLQSLRARFADVDVIYSELATRTVSNPLCSKNRNVALSQDGLFNRYFVGVVIHNTETNDKNKNNTVVVSEVMKGSPAQVAGIKVQDKVLSVNSVPVKNIAEMTKEVQKSNGQAISIIFSSENKTFTRIITPTFKRIKMAD